jgi:RNA polymerase sigma-70 factor (ECF subfamily)
MYPTEWLLSRSLTKAYEKFDTFDQDREGTSFKAWMQTIIKRTFLDDQRRKKTGPQILQDDEMNDRDWNEVESRSIEDELESEQTQYNILEAYKKLSDKKRKIIDLYYVKNRKYKEIAEELNMPIGTVMSQLSRSRAEMKQLIDDMSNSNDFKIQDVEEDLNE